jgi:glycosyltransferase involved in cell wall biosynthesis
LVRYSICITQYNNAPTVGSALESLLSQIDESYEIVVVDNFSKDGSNEILRSYSASNRIRLITKKCSRGVGRELAFENSNGEYIIANIDMDDEFRQDLPQFVEFYHRKCEGNVLLATAEKERWSQNITIGPRRLIKELGGWRNLQWGEDWDLWRRAARGGRYNWTIFSLALEINPHFERKRPTVKMRQRYTRYRDLLKLGRRIFDPGENVSISQRMVALAARITSPFYESYDDGMGPFDPYDPSYFVVPDFKSEVAGKR